MISVTCFGTCRIHNPLKRLARLKLIKLNNNFNLQSYVHSTEEIIQQINFIQNNQLPPQEMWNFIIGDNFKGDNIVNNFHKTDVFVIEISTTKIYKFDKYILKPYVVESLRQSINNSLEESLNNKNKLNDNYSKLLELKKSIVSYHSFERQNYDEVRKGIDKIISLLGKKIVFVTHINSKNQEGKTLKSRGKLIETIEKYSQHKNIPCFNPTNLVDKYCQSIALRDNGVDINHYNPFFFSVIGYHLFENYLSTINSSIDNNILKSIEPVQSRILVR